MQIEGNGGGDKFKRHSEGRLSRIWWLIRCRSPCPGHSSELGQRETPLFPEQRGKWVRKGPERTELDRSPVIENGLPQPHSPSPLGGKDRYYSNAQGNPDTTATDLYREIFIVWRSPLISSQVPPFFLAQTGILQTKASESDPSFSHSAVWLAG